VEPSHLLFLLGLHQFLLSLLAQVQAHIRLVLVLAVRCAT
jgi:hypothetical protein